MFSAMVRIRITPTKVAWRSAQRQPQSKLGNALAHGIRNYAVGSDGGEHDCKASEEPDQRESEARRGDGLAGYLVHEADVSDSK